MAYYEFIRKDTGEGALLTEVDEEICSYLGDEVDEKNYHPMMMALVDLGFSILMSKGGFRVRQKDVDALLQKADIDAFQARVVRWCFCTWWFEGTR